MVTRRAFLLGTVAAGLLPSTAASAATDYSTRETFDRFDREFHASGAIGQPTDNNDHGALAWGQAYVLIGFIRMFQRYGDTHYLDRLVENVDAVLANRDSVRGVTDYRGLSLPAWRATHPYTVGVVDLLDSAGKPALQVRHARAYADAAVATITAGATEGTFTLTVTNTNYNATDTFADLTMDQASPNYAPRRVYAAYPGLNKVTATALGTGVPAAGERPLSSLPTIFAVHTGQITYPIASFCRLVRRSAKLRQQYDTGRYVDAVRAAVAVHDREWERDGSTGAGWLRWVKGMPLPFDGTIQPLNQAHALGSTCAELHAITGEQVYAGRARSLAAGFRASIGVDAGGAAVWPYWPTNSEVYAGYVATGDPETDLSAYTPSQGAARQIEDLSHAAISLEFAATAARHGLGMDATDLARMAKTYVQNLITGPSTAAWQLDGAGDAATNVVQAPRWMPAEPWDHGVFTHSNAAFTAAAPEPTSGSLLLGVAYLNYGR